MEKCIDEGTLQAFLDNELDSGRAQYVARHVSDCDACADLLAFVEEQTAFVFGALEPELNTLVPTQRLWTKINDSIESERSAGWLQALRALLVRLSLPSIAAFASLVVVAGAFVLLISSAEERAGRGLAVQRSTPRIGVIEMPAADTVVTKLNEEPAEVRTVRADFVRREPTRRVVPVRDVADVSSRSVNGEETYVKTIAKLEQRVQQNKDGLLNPSARFAFEKDLAVVNDAITRMRGEVRRNPKSDIARQVLFTSYQDKINLLNSVNERGELMASIR